MRDRLEHALAAWGRLVYRRAGVAIAVSLAVFLALASQLPRLHLDTSTESFLSEGHPARVAYDDFRERFGVDQMILLAVEGDVFSRGFLERLRALHDDVERSVPKLEEVTSLVNARETRGVEGGLVVGELLEDWPETQAELDDVEVRALANDLYRDLLISRDATIATVVVQTDAHSSFDVDGNPIGLDDADALAGFEETDVPERPFLTGEENTEIVLALEAVIARHDAPGFRIHSAGMPVMMDSLQSAMQRDMARFTGLAVVAIAAFLAVLFRRAAGVVLPLVVVAVSVASALAVLAITDTPITLPTQILPSFLLAVGVGASVHLLVIFFQRFDRGESREESIAFALGHSGLAVVMTSLTTAGGLLSFTAADLAPIADFGWIGPTGVMLSLLATLVLLPALIAVFPMRAGASRSAAPGRTRRALVATGRFATSHAPAVVFVSAGMLAVALLGAMLLRFSHDPVHWFPEGHPLRESAELVNRELRGAISLELLVDGGERNALHDPALLDGLDEIRRYASSLQKGEIFVGKTVSLVDVVKEIHQALHENRAEFRVVPRDRMLVAQELLLFENAGTDDLEDFVDTRFQLGRVTFKLPFADGIQYESILDTLQGRVPEILGPDVDATFTGLPVVLGRTIGAVMRSMARSYLIALAVITPLLVLLIGNLRIGLVAMIPNLAPILLTLGLMGWTGIPLDAFTLLIGSIAIGLAVDDTIHFMHNFRRYYERTGDVEEAVRRTLESTGHALLFTTLVLSTGFFLYGLSEMTVVTTFGLLTGLTLIMAFAADIVLAPALVMLVVRPARAAREQTVGAVEVSH